MNTSHRQQTEEGIAKSLTLAGIPKTYHRRPLSEFPHRDAPTLLEWVNGEARLDPRGRVFIGGNLYEDLCIVTARNLHLSGQGVRCMTLLRLVERLANYDTFTDYIDNNRTLAIRQFGSNHDHGAEVFTQRERRDVEDFLTDWLDDGKRLLLHARYHLGAHRWFSSEFLQRVANETDSLEERA